MCGAAVPAADMLEEFDHIVDIIVEIEATVGQRHQLRVAPVGDVDVCDRQHPLDRAAQQRGIMARHRRDDQQLRAALDAFAPEMLELAERLAMHDFLDHADILAVDHGRGPSPNSGLPRGAAAWANTSSAEPMIGPPPK